MLVIAKNDGEIGRSLTRKHELVAFQKFGQLLAIHRQPLFLPLLATDDVGKVLCKRRDARRGESLNKTDIQ